MKLKNNTVLYLEGFNRYKTFILEAAIVENNLNGLFNDVRDLTRLITAANVDQLRYFFYKIQNDLPDSNVGKFIKEIIDITKNTSYNNSVNEIITKFNNNYGLAINPSNTSVVLKLYNAFQTPADLSQPAPAPLQNFGTPYVAPVTTTTPSLTSDTTTTATPADATITPAPAPAPQPSDVPATPPPGPGTPTNLPPNREAEARGQQIRQGSTYRQGARSSQGAVQPISPAGGPTYYIRTSPGRYRPAVQADMDANIPLFIKNPNPVAAMVNPYVRVSDEVRRARRAGPVDQKAMDKEMSAQGYQRVGPGGLRYEKGGRVERKSKLPGAAGSLSNFLGDVGNTLTGR